ncbi:MAG: hypothetical protein ACRCXB_22845 [Aeromonadaceae bacterium]
MNFLKKHRQAITVGAWYLFLTGALVASSIYSSNQRVEAYRRIADRIADVDSKIEAMATEKGFQFIPAPIRPEREGRDL